MKNKKNLIYIILAFNIIIIILFTQFNENQKEKFNSCVDDVVVDMINSSKIGVQYFSEASIKLLKSNNRYISSTYELLDCNIAGLKHKSECLIMPEAKIHSAEDLRGEFYIDQQKAYELSVWDKRKDCEKGYNWNRWILLSTIFSALLSMVISIKENEK